ncbi:MAG: MoxR-like ATPase [Acidimicrobiaceae bacterium]|jgi:MoxR-like ATPase
MSVSRSAGSATAAPAEPSAAFAQAFNAIVDNVGRVIQGKTEAIQLAVLCLLAEGHLLIEDVPGVGKTSMAKALAASIQCSFGRVQFTPDLLPSDVVGVSVFNRATSQFEFRPGPVFANFLLADEINRASPKTQSALLESMAETQVTVDGTTYPLELPFMVIATENPIEHEGTYPLPESQLDRFFMRISIGYPAADAEMQMLDAHADHDALGEIGAVMRANDVRSMVASTKAVHMAPSLKGYLIELAAGSRAHPRLALGMSPRSVLNLQRAAKARAAAAGRSYVVPDDIKALAEPVLAHRLVVTPEAQLAGIKPADALREVLRSVPVPSGRAR